MAAPKANIRAHGGNNAFQFDRGLITVRCWCFHADNHETRTPVLPVIASQSPPATVVHLRGVAQVIERRVRF